MPAGPTQHLGESPRPRRALGETRRWRYGLAVAAVLAAFLVKTALPGLFGPPYILFYPTVMLVAVLAGLAPGLLATGLAAALVGLLILPAGPGGRLSLQDLVGLATFSAGCALISLVAARYRRAREQVLTLEKAQAVQSAEARLRDALQEIRHQDTTELRRADQELRHSEALYRALTERASDMVFILGADGQVLFTSPAATEQLGWTPVELRARPDAELLHPEDAGAVAASFAALAATPGAVARLGFRVRHRDGSWRRLEAVGRNLLDDPDIRGIVANARDVTQQRDLEEQLRQAQKLESIGRLAGGVAHDFNNLLTVILSCSEALRQDLANHAPARPEDVEEIHAAGERARDLTRQLLAFARRQVIAPVILDLGVVVRSSEKLLRRVLGEDVELVVDVQAGLWPILCDQGQLEQVLLNLVVNARDAMPRGGTLTIQTRNVGSDEQDGDQRGDWVLLTVRDTGVGMSAEVKARLFEPFFTTKGQGKGTGLGLATVHGVVAQSGGQIRVESEPGRGAVFQVFLPRSRRVAEARPPAPPRAAARGTESVLVVEDDPQVRAVTVRTLEGAGYQVIASASGAEALDLAARHPGPIELVVSDVVMPGMSGQAVVEGLRARRPGLKALFVSGYTQDAIDGHGPLDPTVCLLPKPFTAPALLAEIRRALDGEAPAPPRSSRFAWSPALEIGDPTIDEQHRELFAAAARFEAALRGGEPSYRLQELFDFLARYVGGHFQAEEELMADLAYPAREAHRREHQAFAERLGALVPRLDPGAPPPAAAALLLDFLQGWLTRHVGQTDRTLLEFARRRGVSPEGALRRLGDPSAT